MAYTNMSGSSDTDLTSGLKRGSDALGPDATTDALGEPEVVEVVEIETYEPTPAGYMNPLDEAAAAANQPGFRWWVVPAVALPVAAGATAVVLLLRRRQQQQQPAPVATYNRLARQSRDWLDAVRSGQATRTATRALQQGVESARTTAMGLPDTASMWRDSAGGLLGTVATSAAAKQATGGVRGALDSVTSFWNTNAPNTKQAGKEQGRNGAAAAMATRAGILRLFANGRAQDVVNAAGKSAQAKQAATKATKAASKASDKVSKASDKAKPILAATAAAASVKAAKAARQTNRTAERAGKRANNAAKRTRAFTFGMLVAATATYWRAWRQRLLDKETRETASGRLVKA